MSSTRRTDTPHLDESFFYAAFPAAVSLDDSSLERNALEPGHMECHISGSGGKVSVIVAAAVALTGLAALVAGSLRQASLPPLPEAR